MKTTIYLIRHGQTEWNVERRMQGRMDSPLTALGVDAARQLAPHMPAVSAVYSSPSGRAMHTARLVFGNREIVPDHRLLEIDLGPWEGRLQAELDIEEPEIHSSFWNAPHRFHKEGAETFEQVAARSGGFLREIAVRHPGEAVAIVSHTTIIRSMLFAIEPREPADFWKPPAVYPASLSEVEIVDGVARIVRFGCTAHHDHAHTGAY